VRLVEDAWSSESNGWVARIASARGRAIYDGDASCLAGSAHADTRSQQLPTKLTVERVRPPTAKRNGEQDEAPEKWVFPAAPSSGKTYWPMRDERDDRELHGKSSRKEARE
jgi:hypothetical protein